MKKFAVTLLGLMLVFLNSTIPAFADVRFPHYVSGTANSLSFLCFTNNSTYSPESNLQDFSVTMDRTLGLWNPRYNQSTTNGDWDDTQPFEFQNYIGGTDDFQGATFAGIKAIVPNTVSPGYYTMWFYYDNHIPMAAPFQVVTDLSQCSNPLATTVSSCLDASNHTLYNVAVASPSAACNGGDQQVSADYGDITSVTAGTGLAGVWASSAESGDFTLSLADSGVVTSKINDLAVTTAKIAANAITEAKLAVSAVTTSIINDLAVTTSVINDLAVTTAKIANDAITSTKLADGAVTTAKINDNAVTDDKLSTDLLAGWVSAGETWTYASSDDPTFTLTISGDKTTKYYPGQRVKLTQTTGGTKYFIASKVAYSAPNTTLTLYGGTDYDLANEAVTAPYYSLMKAPPGFPLDRTKWTVETVDTSTKSQSSPVAGTWYNPGSLGISIPIGAWHVRYQCNISFGRNGNNDQSVYSTLLTSNNSESNTRFTAAYLRRTTGATNNYRFYNIFKENTLNLNSKTQYYLNIKTIDSEDSIGIEGTYQPTLIQAISAYL